MMLVKASQRLKMGTLLRRDWTTVIKSFSLGYWLLQTLMGKMPPSPSYAGFQN